MFLPAACGPIPHQALAAAGKRSSGVKNYICYVQRREIFPKPNRILLFPQDVIAATDVFHTSGGGAAAMAADMGVPFLGRVPLDAALSRAGEEGRSAFDFEVVVGGAAGALAADGGPSKRSRSRAGAGALPALQNIIDQVIAAAEGRAAQDNGGVAAAEAFDLGTVRAL